MSKDIDRELAEFGKNELLNQALDRAVLRGVIRVEAVKDALEIFGNKCVVDAETCQVTLNGLPLDAAVAKLAESRPLWKPTGPDPKVVAQQELEAEALAGSVQAHGRLYLSLGATKAERDRNYAEWCIKHAAKPGKVAAGADDKNTDKDEHKSNPWRADQWNVTAQAKLVREIGLPAAASIAKAAGSFVGATKPSRAA